jgi:hypothetical protein
MMTPGSKPSGLHIPATYVRRPGSRSSSPLRWRCAHSSALPGLSSNVRYTARLPCIALLIVVYRRGRPFDRERREANDAPNARSQ